MLPLTHCVFYFLSPTILLHGLRATSPMHSKILWLCVSTGIPHNAHLLKNYLSTGKKRDGERERRLSSPLH
jgi:hypothetical protein